MDRALYKAEKKAKKKEKIRLKSQVTAVLSKTDLSSKREARRLLSGRILEELPSASDYSDLDSPSEDDSTMKVISKTDRGGTLQSDLAAVTSKTSAKMRLGDMGDMLEEDRGDLRARLGKKRRSDTWRDEDDEEAKGLLERKRRSDTRSYDEEEEEVPVKLKKKTSKDKKEKKSKDKKEKKEKKSKRSKRSHSPGEESPGSERNNALQMAQEFSKEYEPIRSRKIKIKKTENQDDLGLSLDTSLETSRDEISRQEQSEKMSGDVMKDLEDFLND